MFLTGIQSREKISKSRECQSLGPCNSKKFAVVEMFLFCNCRTKYSILAYRKKLFSLYCSLEQPSKNTLEIKKAEKRQGIILSLILFKYFFHGFEMSVFRLIFDHFSENRAVLFFSLTFGK